MSSLPVAPKLDLVEASETSITVQFQPLDGLDGDASYVLQWKEYPDSWEGGAAESAPIAASSSQQGGSSSAPPTKMEAAPLKPGTTYCVRLVVRSATSGDGTPGAELVLDTEQVGCTPQQKSCCAVL